MKYYISLDDAIRAASSCTDSWEPIECDVTVEAVISKLKALPAKAAVPCDKCGCLIIKEAEK